MELCHRILDGKGKPADSATSVAIHIFKEKEISCTVACTEV